MATETLKIVITADNKGALTSLQQTAAETDKFKLSLGDLNTRLSLLKERLNQATEPSRVAKLGGEIKNVTAQIEAQKAEFAKLGADTATATDKMGGGLQKAFSGLRNIANILPGIGLAGMFGLAFEGLMQLVGGFGDLTNAEKATKDTNDELNKSIAKGIGDTAAEIDTVKALTGIINSETASKEEKKRAQDELVKSYPGYFSAQKTDFNNSESLAKITDELTAALIRKANAAAFADLIAKETAKIFLLQNKPLEDQINSLSNLKKGWDFLVGGLKNGGIAAGATTIVTDLASDAIKDNNEQIAASEALVKKLTTALTLNKVAQIANNDAVKFGTKETKTTKETPLEKLKTTYKQDTQALVSMLMEGAMTLDEFQKKIGELNVRTLQNFFKDGGKAASEFGQELLKLQPKFSEFGQVFNEEKLIQRDKKLPSQQGMINKILPEGGGIQKEQLNAGNGLDKFNAALQQTQQIMSVVGPQIDNLFTAMENGANLGQALGDMFKKLAEDIAKAAIKALVFQAILSVLPGGTAVAGSSGGGFMSLFKGLLGLGHAKGGVVTGPQGGHMELLHGTEAILTPAQMSGLVRNSMNAGAVTSMGSNSQQQGAQQGEFTIRGNDLVLALQRSNYSLNLRRGV